MRDMFINALRKKYEAEVDVAKATIEVYLTKAVGIGDHPHIVDEIDKQLEIISCSCDKIKVIDKFYPTEDDIPF